jgi:hypothetical protein
MLRFVFATSLFLLVFSCAAQVRAQDAPSATNHGPDVTVASPAPTPASADARFPRVRLRPATLGRRVASAIVGDLIGGAIGGAVAALASFALPCGANGSWLPGYSCMASIGYAAGLGMTLGALIGGAAGVSIGGSRSTRPGDGWAALGGSAIGLAVGMLLFGLISAADQPTLAEIIGGGVGVALGTTLQIVFYDLGRPALP